MKIKRAELFDSKDEVIVVTCNSYLRNDECLVMGRGAALELKTKCPDIDSKFGILVSKWGGHLGKYGLLLATYNPNQNDPCIFGIFQVKYHYRAKADLDLIKYSTEHLASYADSPITFSMNFPGIGFGQLSAKEVLPIVEVLPDNVTLYVRAWSDLWN